jgi:hypothetical protein
MQRSVIELPAHLGVNRRFQMFLGIAAAIGAVAIVAPHLVMLGFFAGILPGVILSAAPSVFLYALAWYLVRTSILIAGNVIGLDPAQWVFRVAAGLVAAPIVIVAAVAIPRVINAPVDHMVREFRATDRETAAPIAFPQTVAILLPPSIDKQPPCDTLCQRLLYNGAVGKVVATDTGSASRPPVAYWIERRDNCPEPVLARLDVVWPVDFSRRRERGLIEPPRARTHGIRARIAAGECLIDGPGRLEEAGATISFRQIKKGASPLAYAWSLTLDTVSANRLEIVKVDGEVLYRRTEVKAEPLVVPLLVEMRAGLLTSVTYAGWGRVKKVHSQLGPHGRDVLPALLGAAAHAPDAPNEIPAP